MLYKILKDADALDRARFPKMVDASLKEEFLRLDVSKELVEFAFYINQLFFSIACTMNDVACTNAMKWFREQLFFSRDYSDIPKQLLDYSNDTNMLKSITNYAKVADFGIEDMQFGS